MTIVLATLAVLVVVLGGALMVGLPGAAQVGRSWLRRRRRDKVIVHTRDDASIEGLLAASGRDGLVLVGARILGEQGPVPAAGELWVPRERVAFIQHVSP